VSLVTPIVLADGLDVTFYSAVEDVWVDVVQVLRGRRWWSWVAAHLVFVAVVTAAALIADDAQ
jgi:hypothetical protein